MILLKTNFSIKEVLPVDNWVDIGFEIDLSIDKLIYVNKIDFCKEKLIYLKKIYLCKDKFIYVYRKIDLCKEKFIYVKKNLFIYGKCITASQIF